MPISKTGQTFGASHGFFKRDGLDSYGLAKVTERDLRDLDSMALVCALPAEQEKAKPIGNGLRFWKELARTGTYVANGIEFELSPELFDHWTRTFATMVEAGHSVPMPLEHTTDPEKNRGRVLELEVKPNERGGKSLFGMVEFADEESARLANTAQVSVFSPPEWIDGQGTRFERPLRHVALTDYPVIPGLAPFSIVASLVNGEPLMPKLMELLKELKIEVAEDAAEDVMVAALKTKIDELMKNQKEPEKKPEGEGDAPASPPENTEASSTPAPTPVVSASMVKMLGENRRMKLQGLVDAGKISPAVRDDLLTQHASDGALTISLSMTGDQTDGFDTLVETLGKNPAVISMSERSGPQTRLSPDENPLLANAKKRRDAAQG